MNNTCIALIGYGLDIKTAQKLASEKLNIPTIKSKTDNELLNLGFPKHVIEALRDSTRKPIDKAIIEQLLLESALTCCICYDRSKTVVIHHIRKYSESHDNNEENLVVLCNDDHSEAHTVHEIAQNLTKEIIVQFKNDWKNEVKRRKNDALASIEISKERLAKEHYLPFVNNDDICPGCGVGHLKWANWGKSPFGSFSAWFKCEKCGDMVASQEQFGD